MTFLSIAGGLAYSYTPFIEGEKKPSNFCGIFNLIKLRCFKRYLANIHLWF